MQFRLRNPSMQLAFVVMVSICLFQDRSDDISTPRSRWDEMHFSSMLHMRWERSKLMRFLLIRRFSHTCGWKSSSFIVDHSLKLSRSDWRSSVSAANMPVSIPIITCKNHFVSSANIAILELRTTLGMSFT